MKRPKLVRRCADALRTVRKSFWLASLLLIVALGVLWESSPGQAPQIITLPGGQQCRFAGVTWGTNHVKGTMAARLVSLLPSPAENFVRKCTGSFVGQVSSYHTLAPSLVVWFQPLGTNTLPASGAGLTSFSACFADSHCEGAGAGVTMFTRGGYSFDWVFTVVPRRSRELQVRFYSDNPRRPSPSEIGSVRFPNPVYGQFPTWKPEPVPAVIKAGDLEVRLDNVMTGIPVSGTTIALPSGGWGMNYRPAKRGENAATIFDLAFRSPRGTNEEWAVQSADLSDATGNVLSTMLPWGGHRESIMGTLWPGEAAWRLKLELKRTSGFAPEELVTFKNVPVPTVGATNISVVTNVNQGVRVVLKGFVRKPDVTANGFGMYHMMTEICVEIPSHPAGVAMDFVQIKTNTREQPVIYGDGRGAFTRVVYLKSIPTNAETMDITWVVQKTRFVEFLAEPPKP